LVLGRTKELIMTNYVGLDVSQKTTTLCIVDGEGHRQWRGECVTSPEHIAQAVLQHAGAKASIGIETGPMTPWLVHELRSRGLDVICLAARHARAALRMQLNKTDRNDAEGLAQIMRTGWYRAVHVKSFDAHRARALLGARLQLVGMVTRLSNHIRGVLKTFGMLPGSVRGGSFAERVELLVAERPDVAPIVRPMLAAWSKLREQVTAFDKAVRTEVKQNRECRLLMSVPGLGPITVLAYVSAIENPNRFRRSRLVGAHLGLTPRRYQSGDVDRSGHISKCGDTLARLCLYEAATVIMTRIKRPLDLKVWAAKIAKRSGTNKARVALARKLAVILHSIWRTGEPFRWSPRETVA
jgi:transposase